MNKTFVLIMLIVCTRSLFADTDSFLNMQSLDEISLKPYQSQTSWEAPFEFSTNPISLKTNYYDYFIGSVGSMPMQRSITDMLNGNWFVYSAKYTHNSKLRTYKAFIPLEYNGTFNISNLPFGFDDLWEELPSLALTEGGRPFLAYQTDLDFLHQDEPYLEIGFGYDAVVAGVALAQNSDLFSVFDAPLNIAVNGTSHQISELLNPTIQIGPSPENGHQRVYICGQNSCNDTEYSSANIVVFYQDFTEEEIEYQTFTGDSWEYTTIPVLNEWNTSTTECRKPFMAFKVFEDALYYVGYHEAVDFQLDYKNIIAEPSIDVFVCDNYGEGQWEQHSVWDSFQSYNPNYVNPTGFHTGRFMEREYFDTPINDLDDEDMYIGIGQSSHFNVGVDGMGRLHIPALFTQKTYSGYYYPELHTIKEIIFNPLTDGFTIQEVYPQSDNPTFPVQFTSPNGGLSVHNNRTPWYWWDADSDGIYDEVLDDGTWDNIDDNITPADTDYWGRPVLKTIWPFQYWDEYALADNSLLPKLNHLSITNTNYEGMMAIVWHDTQKSRLYNQNPLKYAELAPYEETIETKIAFKNDMGLVWSDPISLNNVETPELAGQNPSFAYPSNEIDFFYDSWYNPYGVLYLVYNDDTSYGSSILGIGPETAGAIKYAVLNVDFSDAPASIENKDNDVAGNNTVLNQNYPNPFNPETTISFITKEAGDVFLDIYNIKGQKVKSLVNEFKEAGNHQVVWNGKDNNNHNVVSGIYLYKIRSGKFSSTRKMILMK
ncbi:T9SS type A sorting domain-containing protein [bacterium]|nr:T9SS type A sorting domain-containing protein [bacterium]